MTDMASDSASPSPAEGSSSSSKGGSWIGGLVDLCNPVLVKEVRQAQRGRVFVIALIVSVLLALLATTMMSLELPRMGDKPGRNFFTMSYAFLCGSMLIVVPFQAFISMGAEWDDHTFEMLVLSNLKPRQIVLGKILAALIQGLLFLATFLPFIATAFLLRGVDVMVMATILALTLIGCLWLSTVATMLSTLTRNRFLRVLLMVAMAGSLLGFVSGAVPLAGQWLRRPDIIVNSEFWIWLAQFLVVMGLTGALAFCISCNLLAHEEENRSSNIRILFSAAMAAYFVMAAVNMSIPRIGMPREAVFGSAIFVVFALAALGVFLMSEPDRLGRRVRPTVPKSRTLALLTAPWYPGGGRGVIYILLHLAVLIVATFALGVFAEEVRYGGFSGSTPVDRGLLKSGGLALLFSPIYLAFYTLVPLGVVGLIAANSKGGRAITRVVAIFSPMLWMIVPAILGLLLSNHQLQTMRHIGNPGVLIGRAFDGHIPIQDQVFFVAVPVALIGLLLHVPRVIRSLRETLAVSGEAGRTVGAVESDGQ